MVKERFAKSIMENQTRDFYSEINRMKNSKARICDIVDGVGNSSDIANLFADKYEELYSSVPNDHDDMASLKVEIMSAVDKYNEVCVVSFNDVVDAVNSLKHGK